MGHIGPIGPMCPIGPRALRGTRTCTMLRTLLAIVPVLALCGASLAASPSLGSVQPRGVQRGTDANLVLNGGNLADAQEVVFYSPGFTVTKLEAGNAAQVKVAVKVAPDARLGEHSLR